ncbi:hypothetical protein [Anaeromyxobacter oryzae]|uniref:Uncharacterized protein n=1 Tax=Anaeromyxobacter oryzae TaxID=2918170 RepID=A0ABM7X3T4_9BACT|nr:hypothetical protein [Anaeromyxobacter oryzae]BDG06463.1 hypothetical protein AMOR_54590 [Anaeromyxobacter oryzae]
MSLEPVLPIEPVFAPVLSLVPAAEPVDVSLDAAPLPVPPIVPLLEPIDPRLESSVFVELLEPGEVVSGLVEPAPVPYFELEEEPASGDVEVLLPEPPILSVDVWPDVEDPVPDCACAGGAATSSPAIARLAAVPHPKYLIPSSPESVRRFSLEARLRGRGSCVLASIR